MNHLSTATDLSSSVVASAIAANSSGRSHQYAAGDTSPHQLSGEHGRGGTRGLPGNSVSEMGERMNGGAVSDERSPETDAILHVRNTSAA